MTLTRPFHKQWVAVVNLRKAGKGLREDTAGKRVWEIREGFPEEVAFHLES